MTQTKTITELRKEISRLKIMQDSLDRSNSNEMDLESGILDRINAYQQLIKIRESKNLP